MNAEALEELRNAGCPVDMLSQAQRDVFAALTSDELQAILSVQRRLQAVSADVEGHDLKLL